MIIDAILLVFQGVLEIILSPLTVINIGIDFIASIPVIGSFVNVIAYILPWSNLFPLFVLLIALFSLRIVIAIVRFIVSIIPGL